MTLPPERVTVKRSAAEAPLDLLYFERPQKRLLTSEWEVLPDTIHFYYKLKRPRLRRRSPAKSPNRSKPAIPTNESAEPDKEVYYVDAILARLAQNTRESQGRVKAAAKEPPAQPIEPGQEATPDVPATQPRRLFFDFNASTSAGKRKRNDSDSPLAVFVENKHPRIEVEAAPDVTEQPDSPQAATPSRKRPNVKATLSREATLSRSISQLTLNETFMKASQEFADEEVAKNDQAEELKRKIKAALNGNKDHEDIVMTDSELEGDFVYDTYIRVPVPRGAPMPDCDLTKHLLDPGVGYLVIQGDDQEFWERFGEDEEDDEEEWDSDQEDENAENWYGADYPEEEMDSEDEYDENPYKFRRSDSDNEEYGSEDEYGSEKWTDEESDEDSPRSWKPKPHKSRKTEPVLEEEEYDEIYTGLDESRGDVKKEDATGT